MFGAFKVARRRLTTLPMPSHGDGSGVPSGEASRDGEVRRDVEAMDCRKRGKTLMLAFAAGTYYDVEYQQNECNANACNFPKTSSRGGIGGAGSCITDITWYDMEKIHTDMHKIALDPSEHKR